MKTHFFFPLLSVTALLLSACAGAAQAAPAPTVPTAETAPSPDSVVAEGRLLPGKHIQLTFPTGGRVAESAVAEGDAVQAGDLLARLEGSADLLAHQAAAELEILTTQQAIADLQEDTLAVLAGASAELEAALKNYDAAERGWNGKGGTHPGDFDMALSEYLAAEKAVREAQEGVDDEAGRPNDSPARQQAAEDLGREQARRAKAYAALLADYENPPEGSQAEKRTALFQAITRLETARTRLAELNGGTDPEPATLLNARLQAAQAAAAAAEEGLRLLEVRAPWDGILTSWNLEAGEVVAPAQPIGTLADRMVWFVETSDLNENGVVSVQIGAPVEVTVNALPGKTYAGVVETIEGYGVKSQGDMTYTVRIRLEENDPRWYWNMNVKVTINP